MPRWPSDWLGLSPEASHTARVAGSHHTNGFGFSNTVELRLCACSCLTFRHHRTQYTSRR
ncbi:hypothetical protein BRL93_20405 [Xanthomonas oryzae pv. oryzae]|nr:hypothetical protein BRL93_20405 [Xanthomonas oryzae pv. oryzae]UWU51765.1 hypothetical protein BRN95_01480 [Xanthomonas oryzae pv. oryzae]